MKMRLSLQAKVGLSCMLILLLVSLSIELQPGFASTGQPLQVVGTNGRVLCLTKSHRTCPASPLGSRQRASQSRSGHQGRHRNKRQTTQPWYQGGPAQIYLRAQDGRARLVRRLACLLRLSCCIPLPLLHESTRAVVLSRYKCHGLLLPLLSPPPFLSMARKRDADGPTSIREQKHRMGGEERTREQTQRE